jgi:hypothetical protein
LRIDLTVAVEYVAVEYVAVEDVAEAVVSITGPWLENKEY